MLTTARRHVGLAVIVVTGANRHLVHLVDLQHELSKGRDADAFEEFALVHAIICLDLVYTRQMLNRSN